MAAVVLALATLARTAAATDCAPTSRASTCIDGDELWARPGASRFVALAPTQTLDARDLAVGLLASYERRPIVLHLASSDPAGTDVNALGDVVTTTALAAYGLGARVEADIAVPLTVYQNGIGVTALTRQQPSALPSFVLRDPRIGAAWAFVHDPDGFSATARADVAVPVGDRDAFAGTSGPTFAPSVAGSYRVGRFAFAGEIGARVGAKAELLGAPLGSRALAGLGASADVLSRDLLAIGAEAFTLVSFGSRRELVRDPVTNGIDDAGSLGALATAEWLGSVRTAPLLNGDVAFQIAAGTGIPLSSAAPTQPSFRTALAVRYAPTHRDRDRDGIPDADDACPDDAEDRDGFADSDGCPDPDDDGDGVPDASDRCPREAGPAESAGCPAASLPAPAPVTP